MIEWRYLQVIEPDLWLVNDQVQAEREGWRIDAHTSPGRTRIVVSIGEYSQFASDLQAAEYVIKRMHEGSAFHERAWIAVVKAQLSGSW